MGSPEGVQLQRAFGLAAAAGGIVVDVTYLRAIAEQGSPVAGRVAFVAVFIAAMSLSAFAGSVRPGAAILTLAAASGFLALGFLGLWSIGFALIAVGVMTAAATRPIELRPTMIIAAIVVPWVILAAGFLLTTY
jgi:hypothetical protein